MTREELIDIGEKIVSGFSSKKDETALIEIFNRNVPHPDGAGLFFWPENYNARKDDISQYNPSVEEIVDKCLAYKPIQL